MTQQEPPRPISRRQLARGAIWTMPAVMVSVPAPARATSHCLGGDDGDVIWDTPGISQVCLDIPAASTVYYEVAGGEGGLTATSGKGAKLAGRLDGVSGAPVNLRLVVPEGGISGPSNSANNGGDGYGHGGGTPAANAHGDIVSGSGGGGAAILLGNTGNHVVVAAGGGGGGTWNATGGTAGCTTNAGQFSLMGASGDGGAPAGVDAEENRSAQIVPPPAPKAEVTAHGGEGATGGTHGAAGHAGAHTVPATGFDVYLSGGHVGGNHGGGMHQGGNGGHGAFPWGGHSPGLRAGFMGAGGGGGGGYAGGGGGGNAWLSATECHRWVAIGGGGGGGSSYLATHLSVTPVDNAYALNGTNNAADGSRAKNGHIRIWWSQ
ncbi:MAG: hypothetical protein ACK5LN_12025 [Propioniciclava sp.]